MKGPYDVTWSQWFALQGVVLGVVAIGLLIFWWKQRGDRKR